jgi:hypothetical protein
MPTNLPWFATNGRIVDADGVLVCEASPEDAAAIVEAMNLRAACEVLEGAIKPKATLTVQYAWYEDEQPAHFVAHLKNIADPHHRGYLFGRPSLADALQALAGEVTR